MVNKIITMFFRQHDFKIKKNGFTLIELLVVIGISLIIFTATLSVSFKGQTGGQLNATVSLVVQALRAAKVDSITRFNHDGHGVFFEINPESDDRYIRYKGATYLTRDLANDITMTLDSGLSFSTVIVGMDVNFSKGVGLPSATGTVSVIHVAGDTRVITINELGVIDSN